MAASASLLSATDARSHVHLVVGSNPLAASRCAQSLSVGACPVLLAPDSPDLHYTLRQRIDAGEIKWIPRPFGESDLFTLGRDDVDRVVDAVFVTSGSRSPISAHISSLCRRNRIPVNVVDAPHLCSFTLLSTHVDGPLQIGVTTNGRGCKLASRIRRELAAALPSDLGAACLRLGDARRRIQDEDRQLYQCGNEEDENAADESTDQSASFNRLVTDADLDATKTRRMRWLSQICEYWPLKRLAAVTDDDVETILQAYTQQQPTTPALLSAGGPPSAQATSEPANPFDDTLAVAPPKQGCIILAGSGPGHPDLLTRATHKAIECADLILADKLVPAGVLDLIPRRTPVRIARKFPGNADAAQEELHELAAAGVREGKIVLRLKQGDPYVYGRGGEEVEYFNGLGLGDRVTVLPGVTSALSAPLFAGIPPTQRDVADQVLVCTGTGKKGKPPSPPEFIASRTVVFLMALHRIEGLVTELTTHVEAEAACETNGSVDEKCNGNTQGLADKKARILWPLTTPCAVIERASCPDQRVIRTTLGRVAEAIDCEGSRPPGLLVAGRACAFLHPLEDGRAWSVEDGFRGLDFGSMPLPAELDSVVKAKAVGENGGGET